MAVAEVVDDAFGGGKNIKVNFPSGTQWRVINATNNVSAP